MQLTPAELSGIHYYRQENCAACHNVTGGETAKAGPESAEHGAPSRPGMDAAALQIAASHQPGQRDAARESDRSAA